MQLVDGECVSGQYFQTPYSKKVYLAFTVILFTVFWAVPVTCFAFLYGMVAIRMQRRKNDSNFESNRYEFIFSLILHKLSKVLFRTGEDNKEYQKICSCTVPI